MHTTLQKTFETQVKNLSIEKSKLYSILVHKIDFDEKQSEIRLSNLLHFHLIFFIDKDYGIQNHFFVRLSKGGYFNHRSVDFTGEHHQLSPISIRKENVRDQLVHFVLKELDKYSEERLLKLYMSPSTKDYENKRCATDTLVFLNWINNTDRWYDLVFDDRISKRPCRFTFYTEGAAGPGWGLSTYKIKKIENYNALSKFSVKSRYRYGKEHRFPLWTLLFSVSIDDLPDVLRAYINEMQIPVSLFQVYRKKYNFRMQLLHPDNKDLLH